MARQVATAESGAMQVRRDSVVAPERAVGPSTKLIWDELGKASFAVIGYVTPHGEPRSSGVVYGVNGRHLFVGIAPDSWKARQISEGQQVAVTVPVRRGGPLSLLMAIPPATISFHARVVVHPARSVDIGSVSKKLESLIPKAQRTLDTFFELVPHGAFLTYGIGVSLKDMLDPAIAEAHVPIE
jgi:hypothetical protein